MAASEMMEALMELCQDKHIDQLYPVSYTHLTLPTKA